jgi:hypothetical protein
LGGPRCSWGDDLYLGLAWRVLALVWGNRVKASIFVGIVAVVTASCSPVDGTSAGLEGGADKRETPVVVSGEQALSLYGITPDPPFVPTPTVLDQTWFPRSAWVSASVLPYEDQAPIRILPVYSDPDLDVGGTWLGDLPEGEKVDILSVDPAGRSCYVVGEAAQGWLVEGWVACNRLLHEEPTTVSGS